MATEPPYDENIDGPGYWDVATMTAGWEYREYAAFARLCAALGNVADDRPVAEVMEMAAETINDHAQSIRRATSCLLWPPYDPEERRRKALDHLGYRPPLERGDAQ
jgi:hypothetical protein